ncbi:hypothetical protein [Bacteriovorax sp. Seq25_V]|uniref:hypothetical protein n=1 Tax=Bacteriovorax sp. Seq25_V TaxID=1201288 RepID=UPI00038A0F3F|nr:hypothetical protein [Bacteriovorax sp. Seq25_V]EQC46654.1 putative lipoprotein [Bacteriovorax sp. Seq25_V]
MLKKITFVLSLIFLASCATDVVDRTNHGKRPLSTPKQYFNGVKKRIALVGFFNESPYGGEDLAITATEELRRELSRVGQFIIDNQASRIFGSSKEIYAGGGVKLVQMARRAKDSGLNFVVFGRVIEARIREKTDEIGVVRQTKAYTESKVEIRIFDVNANKEIFTETVRGYADDSSFRFFVADQESKLEYRRDLLRYVVKIAVRKSIPQIVNLAQKLEWVGRVAKIIGTKIYINAGRSAGVNIGDILKVVTEGVEIYDPETGALMGVSKGEIKGTIEIIDFVGGDASIAVLHSGGSVAEGDFVQLY